MHILYTVKWSNLHSHRLPLNLESRNIKSLKMFQINVTFLIIVISIIHVESRPHWNKTSISVNVKVNTRYRYYVKVPFNGKA